MDFKKIKSLQSKFNRLKDGLQESGDDISAMEKRLLVSYLDEMKAVIMDRDVAHKSNGHHTSEPILVPDTTMSDPVSEVVRITTPEPTPVITEVKVATIEDKPQKADDSSAISEEIMALFDEVTPTELSDKIALIRIADLNKSMSINERIFTQKELFNNDQASFQRTLSELNGLGSFDEARSYLMEKIIPQYDWSNPNKVKKVSTFVKLVRRRFL